MKPARFEYVMPRSLREAVDAMEEHGADASVLAGGQSLVPAMNFRLARPAVLVDLNGVKELAGIREGRGEGVTIGAMTRQRAVERSRLVAERTPLLAEAITHVGHPQIRNRGTMGGSIAHADPAAELPAVLLAHAGAVRLLGPEGERRVLGSDFCAGPFGTTREEGEILTEVELPALPAGAGWSFREMARRHGDFALVGVAAVTVLDGGGLCSETRLVLFGVGSSPVTSAAASQALGGREPTPARIREAAAAAAEEVDPPGDQHASREYRRHLVRVLGRRALEEAFGRARPP